jgi:hypothetical protein
LFRGFDNPSIFWFRVFQRNFVGESEWPGDLMSPGHFVCSLNQFTDESFEKDLKLVNPIVCRFNDVGPIDWFEEKCFDESEHFIHPFRRKCL